MMSTTMMNIVTTSTTLIQKNSDDSNNDTLRNYVNKSDNNSNNFKENSSEKDDVNNIAADNNIDNVKFRYNCKRLQISHDIQKYCESLSYAIQFIRQYNTNICQRKLNHVYIRTKEHNAIVEYYLYQQ